MKIKPAFQILVWGCVSFGLALSACGGEHQDIPLSISDAQYSFAPETVQIAIDNQEPDLFNLEWVWERNQPTPPARATRAVSSPDFAPFQWVETDFRRVVNTFAEQVDGRAIGNMEPWKIAFETNCQYATIGIQRIIFSFLSKQGPQDYLQWSADVDLPISRLSRYEAILSDVADEKLPLEKNHITAEAALQIAEQAGGIDFRRQVNNDCFVSASIIRSDSFDLDNKWMVSYRQFTATLYEVHISPDGQAKIVITPEP